MPAGRPARPLELQRDLARGDGTLPGGRKIKPSTEIAIPAQALPTMPVDLGDRGEVEWFKIWEAGARWLHPNQDYAWVEQIVRAYDDIDAFRAQVALEGRIAKGSMGQVIAHPLISEIRKCEDTIRKCLSVLGFSPTDRARLGLSEIKKQKGLADLQQRTKGNRA